MTVLRHARIFLSGGTGFLGSSVLEAYARTWESQQLEGTITVLSRDPLRFLEREPSIAGHPSVKLHAGEQDAFEFPDGEIDFIIHAAVEYGNPSVEFEKNLDGTRRILELARAKRTKRVLFTSSGAVYGPQLPGLALFSEDHPGAPPLHPSSAYAEAKRASELMGLVRGDADGFDFLIARCFAFLGRRLPLDKGSAAGQFIGGALKGGPIVVKGDGTPVRSYLDASDLATWLWTILLEGKHGRPYNVGSEEAISLGSLADRIRDVLAPSAEVRVLGQAAEAAPRQVYVPSTFRARTELGLSQTVSLDDAIRNTAEWHWGRTK